MILVGLDQGLVLLTERQQFFMCTHLNHLAAVSLILKNADTISFFDCAQPMGNHNGGSLASTLLHQGIEAALHYFFALVVQRRSGLVQYQDLRITH